MIKRNFFAPLQRLAEFASDCFDEMFDIVTSALNTRHWLTDIDELPKAETNLAGDSDVREIKTVGHASRVVTTATAHPQRLV